MTLSRAENSVVDQANRSAGRFLRRATMGQARRVDSTAAATTFLPLRLLRSPK